MNPAITECRQERVSIPWRHHVERKSPYFDRIFVEGHSVMYWWRNITGLTHYDLLPHMAIQTLELCRHWLRFVAWQHRAITWPNVDLSSVRSNRLISQIPRCIRQLSHNATFCNMCTRVHISVTKWCIVGYGTASLWDLCNRSMTITWDQFYKRYLSHH